jgi:hypothetical protein
MIFRPTAGASIYRSVRVDSVAQRWPNRSINLLGTLETKPLPSRRESLSVGTASPAILLSTQIAAP